ncbi:MAG TPA: response regulator [Burkholderiaceae bacterium]|nr:response regulator [Burkholderiaceae bacterium]HMX09866.1 response regulator [Burkholderiaceae bacterium]HMY99289.1 response regulator [Burkholderiaceae bacterium]HNB44635.1 response regulator [Burkholderiaceae bacterium]HNG81287.1 response regulator [Burkholderiaceae bacterium]
MTHRILIVEDQADIRKLIRMTLEFGDFELHEAADGESGLNLARAVRPHVMLLDVMMPGLLDGYQVCRHIKQDPQLKAIQVIMLTARGQATDVAAGEDAGADAYLVKPFSPLELIDRVEAMVSPNALS